jgi:hypothetical protein
MIRFLLAFFLALALAFALSACPHPLPPTPVPATDAAPPDEVFSGRTFDCTGLDTTSAQPYALTCADLENTGECLINYTKTGVPPALMACAARDAEMLLFVEVAKETAGEATKVRAGRLRAWMWAERMTLRGAP